MAQLAFMLSLFLIAASGTIFAAGEVYAHGFTWADQICNGAPSLCENRYWLACAGAVMTAVYFVLRELEV
jgi:hypothetical protein